MTNEESRRVMLSPRELSYKNLPSRIWINEHFTYTHGYGVTLGPVNRISAEGLPEFFIQDIPPVSIIDLKVTRPEIYYGEIPNEYVFTRTKAEEFDYPSGEKNVPATYTGRGGVTGLSFSRKLVFAAYFGSLKILLSNDILPESRILYHRQIRERVAKVAPFLRLDQDPYLVITQGGRLVWLVDGYTISDRMPYAQPFGRVGNYIRNSVKATVDAYDGSVDLYVSDPQDPLIQTYQRIFPGLLKPLEQMPRDLRAHLRYPQDLFTIQSHVYATYHMQDPQIFYNKEDLWSIPKKQEKDMEPYYTIMKLPKGSNAKETPKEEFILLIPFTPAKRDNMAAWLAARSDVPHYGKQLRMDTNLEAALEGIFGGGATPSGKQGAVAKAAPVPASSSTSTLGPSPPAVLAKQALEHFNRAQAALRDQDWTRYGEELKKMRAVLEELAKK